MAQVDLRNVCEVDALLAIVNGTPPDEGVILELEAAIALAKPIFFCDDFRWRPQQWCNSPGIPTPA